MEYGKNASRRVDDEFWWSERIGAVLVGSEGRSARYLFLSIWGMADSNGLVRGHPQYLRSVVFPYDNDVTASAVEAWVDLLRGVGLVEPIRVDGRSFLRVLDCAERSARQYAEPELSLRDPYEVKVRLLTPEERATKEAEAEANVAKWRAEEAERRARIKGKPHVYFIQQGDSGAIKIGCSKNPSQRLAGLQTGHSEPLRLLTCAVGSQAQERALHDRFAHLRVSGEWFRPADDLLAYIRLVNDRRAL